MNELQEFNLDDLYEKFRLSDEEFDYWLASLRLLHRSMTCTCGQPMRLKQTRSGKKLWQCNRAVHRPEQPQKGFKKGTFFENSTLTTKEIFKLSYFWAMRYPIEHVEHEMPSISHPTIVKWYGKFRRICRDYFRRHPILLGGPNVSVEADETYMSRKHGRRGRRVRRHSKWVFSIVERGSGFTYSTIVRRRNAATLLRIILQHVRAGTEIFTDEWRSYRVLARFPSFSHRVVNHGVHFVDPNTGISYPKHT